MKHLLLLAIFISAVTATYTQKPVLNTDAEQLYETFQKAMRNQSINVRDTALASFSQVYNQYSDSMADNDKHTCAMAYLYSAQANMRYNKITTAFDEYLKGLKIIEQCTTQDKIEEFYSGIADVYWMYDDLYSAIEYYQKAYRLCSKTTHPYFVFKLLNYLTGLYCYTGHYDKALEYMEIANRRKEYKTLQKFMNMLHHGIIYTGQEEYGKAAHILKQSEEYAISNNLATEYLCSSYEELYKLYMQKGDNDSTELYLNKSYNTLKSKMFIGMMPSCLKHAADFYEKIGDIKKAAMYRKEYSLLEDTIFLDRDFNKIRYLQLAYETEKTDRQITLMRAKEELHRSLIEKQRTLIATMSLTILLALTFTIYVYKQKIKFAKLYEHLFFINKDIMQSEKELKEERARYQQELAQKDNTIKALTEATDKKEEREVLRRAIRNMDTDKKQSLISDIKDVLENREDIFSTDFSLDRLAELVDSNSTYVSQVINESYGKSFYNVINEYRIKEARNRLTTPDIYGKLTIKAIAESVGYKSQTTFIKVFKDMTGMTPSIFQKISIEKAKEVTNQSK